MLSFSVWDSPRHGDILTALPAGIPGGIPVQMGVGLHGHLVHINTHVCLCVCMCLGMVTYTRPPEPWHVRACPWQRHRGRKACRHVCSGALRRHRAGGASCTMSTQQCVAVPDTGQQLQGEGEGQINRCKQTCVGHESLQRNRCTYNIQGTRNTM